MKKRNEQSTGRCMKKMEDGYNCGSYAINEDPSQRLCDRCFWKTKWENLLKQFIRLKESIEKESIEKYKTIGKDNGYSSE